MLAQPSFQAGRATTRLVATQMAEWSENPDEISDAALIAMAPAEQFLLEATAADERVATGGDRCAPWNQADIYRVRGRSRLGSTVPHNHCER